MKRNEKQIRELKKLIALSDTPNTRVYFGDDGSILTIVNMENAASMDWGYDFDENLDSWMLYNRAADNPESTPNIIIPSLWQTLKCVEDCNYAEYCNADEL
jgi:hypothetical protein